MNKIQGVTEIAEARAGIDVVLPVIKDCIIFKGDVVFPPVCKFEGQTGRGQIDSLDTGNQFEGNAFQDMVWFELQRRWRAPDGEKSESGLRVG